MKRTLWLSGLFGLGLTLTASVGCQTQVTATGQTLPSPRYLDHPPQFIPPSPPFPLSRELAGMERTAAAVGTTGMGPATPLPPPVPVPVPPVGDREPAPLPPP